MHRLSGFCHFGLVLFMVLWQSPDTPVMSGIHVSVRLRVCSSRVLEPCALSRLHALFHVGAWCSDPGTHVLSFGYVTGFGHSCSTFCLFVWVCVHLCYILCCVARSLCIQWLRAFMLSCLVWTRGLWVFSLATCSCPVLHMAGDLFAGHVLVFLFYNKYFVMSMSGTGEWMRRGPKCRRKTSFLITMINKTNKNYPVGEKQTGQGWTRLDTRHRRPNIWQRTHTELQTQGDYKGSKWGG